MAGGDRVELVIAHPNGHAEVAEGTLAGTSLSLASTAIIHTATAKQVDAIEREVNVAGEVMTYSLRMAAMGEPLDGHLEAELRLGATH
jgi:THAP4-like, heme-binding beta-barrel domain